MYEFLAGGGCLSLDEGSPFEHPRAEGSQRREAGAVAAPPARAAQGAATGDPAQRLGRVREDGALEEPDDTNASKNRRSLAEEQQDRERHDRHDKEVEKWNEHWTRLAAAKNWDGVVANLEVYRYSGARIDEDPRREEKYREDVIAGLLLRPEDTRTSRKKTLPRSVKQLS